jgi:hypothetical protein
MNVNKKQIVLAALASGDSHNFTPVQVQKLLFVLDRRIAGQINGPHFDFKPYDYGPFDKGVYSVLDELQTEGLVDISYNGYIRRYKLTALGQTQGQEVLASLPQPTTDYIKEVSSFIKRQSFANLVSAIYRAFPDMKINSIFK